MFIKPHKQEGEKNDCSVKCQQNIFMVVSIHNTHYLQNITGVLARQENLINNIKGMVALT